MSRRPPLQSGFSLVEVTLAMGIASFSLVVMLGVFGSVIKQRGELTGRKESYDAIYALQSQFNEPDTFARVYDWIVSGLASGQKKELLYLRYRAGTGGAPDADGLRYRSEWVDPGDASSLTPAKLAAAEGRWIKATLEWDDRANVNPVEAAALPATAGDYPHGRATLRIRCYPVPSATFSLPANATPALDTALSLHR